MVQGRVRESAASLVVLSWDRIVPKDDTICLHPSLWSWLEASTEFGKQPEKKVGESAASLV
jgi:hypothetical protein